MTPQATLKTSALTMNLRNLTVFSLFSDYRRVDYIFNYLDLYRVIMLAQGKKLNIKKYFLDMSAYLSNILPYLNKY